MRNRHYLIVAGLCLATSTCLAALPIVAPHAVLAPFIVCNWTLFMTTGFMLRRRVKVSELTWKQSRNWDRLFVAELVAFTAAAWFALWSGNPVL